MEPEGFTGNYNLVLFHEDPEESLWSNSSESGVTFFGSISSVVLVPCTPVITTVTEVGVSSMSRVCNREIEMVLNKNVYFSHKPYKVPGNLSLCDTSRCLHRKDFILFM